MASGNGILKTPPRRFLCLGLPPSYIKTYLVFLSNSVSYQLYIDTAHSVHRLYAVHYIVAMKFIYPLLKLVNI